MNSLGVSSVGWWWNCSPKMWRTLNKIVKKWKKDGGREGWEEDKGGREGWEEDKGGREGWEEDKGGREGWEEDKGGGRERWTAGLANCCQTNKLTVHRCWHWQKQAGHHPTGREDFAGRSCIWLRSSSSRVAKYCKFMEQIHTIGLRHPIAFICRILRKLTADLGKVCQILDAHFL